MAIELQLNQLKTNLARMLSRVQGGQISPALAAAQLNMPPGYFNSSLEADNQLGMAPSRD